MQSTKLVGLAALACVACTAANSTPAVDTNPLSPSHTEAERAVPEAWTTHALPECALVADFPVVPVRSSHVPQGGLTVVQFVSALPNSGAIVVDCFTLPDGTSSPDVLLDHVRQGFLETSHATVRTERGIPGGRQLQLEVSGEQALARILLNHDKVLIAFAAPLRLVGAETAQHFLNGLQIASER